MNQDCDHVDVEDNGDGDIYIMVKCLCVCHKSDIFRIQGSRTFLMFLDTFRIQMSGNRKTTKSLEKSNYFQGILSFLLFQDTFRNEKYLETGKQQNPFKR